MKNKLTNEEIEEIVNIHMHTLPNDLVPQLGKEYLISFYNYLNKSEKEMFFLEREDNKIIACCIVSFEPATLFNRVFKHTFLKLTKSLIINFVIKNKFRKYIINILIEKNDTISISPEIVYMYVNDSFQNRGVGKKLINSVNSYLLLKKYNSVYVKTINDKQNDAIKFYKKNKFIEYKHFNYASNQYLYLKKKLN